LIAEEAGVNNAALYYYFGTKEQLIEAALNRTSTHKLEDTKEILASDKPIEIREIFEYIISGVLKFPNIIRAHMVGPLFYSERQTLLTDMLETWVMVTANAIKDVQPSIDLHQLELKLDMIFSVILLSGLFNNPPIGKGWLNIGDEKQRYGFIDDAVRMVLNAG
jgi:AcrR family transcriptional regulator